MGNLKISRRRFVTAGAIGTVGALLVPEAVFADEGQPQLLRWDLIRIHDGVILSGGTDVAKASNGDTVSVTSSGEAQPNAQTATGGGTFIHRKSNGKLVAQGVYFVTGFTSFVPASPGGNLVGSGLTDGIGTLEQTAGGVLSVNIHAIVDAPPDIAGGTVDAVLGIDCGVGSTTIKEGNTLSVAALGINFVQDTGFTLFHVLQQ
jgi:hypothetical protein